MIGIRGFDCDHYPGDAMIAWLRTHGQFRVVCLYLAHAPDGSDKGWIGKRGFLAANGWGLLPAYVGLQKTKGDDFSADAGKDHGQKAAGLMEYAGFAKPSIVYLDLESGDQPDGDYADYIGAWIASVRSEGYESGLYCSHLFSVWSLKQTPFVWSFHVPAGTTGQSYDPDDLPAGLIDPGCVATQYRQEVKINGLVIPPAVDGGGIDLDFSLVADPSNVAAVRHALNI